MKNLSEKVVNRQRELVTLMLDKLAPIVIEKGHPADRVLARFFKDHREFGSRDRRFLSEVFFSAFRWRGLTKTLGLSCYEAAALSAHLDQTEIHPALQNAHYPWTPLGGKTLDEKIAAVNAWYPAEEVEEGEEEVAPLTKDDLLVPNVGKDICWPEGGKEKFFEQLQQRPPTWVRLRNDLFKKVMLENGISFVEHPVLENAVSITAGRPLGALGCNGQYEVQDIASQAVVAVAAPEKGSDWWDACAGAGGKALQLADAVGGSGKVFATDVREEALANCKKRARTNGTKNVRLQAHDLASAEPFTKEWDGVLVDAPCSGWGTWSRNPDARWRSDPRDPAQKRNLQKRMLRNAAVCVKPGGLLIYAVCTLTTEETTDVIEGFLKETEGFELEPFNHPLTNAQTDGSVQIWPWEGPGDGMYIARLRRTA